MRALLPQTTKSKNKYFTIRDGIRTDLISDPLIDGCTAGCSKTYCNLPGVSLHKIKESEHLAELTSALHKKACKLTWPKVPNIHDSKLYTVDIGKTTDLGLMYSPKVIAYIAWVASHAKLRPVFSTKFPSNIDKLPLLRHKPRVIIPLVPQWQIDALEITTDPLLVRLDSIPVLEKLGFQVEIDFGPILLNEDWMEEFEHLLQYAQTLDLKNIELTAHIMKLEYYKYNLLDQDKKVYFNNMIIGNNSIAYSAKKKFEALQDIKEMVRYKLEKPLKYII
jgi:DNA repair photolyase